MKQTKRKLCRMGHPVLRQKGRELARQEILSPWFQDLLNEMDTIMQEHNGIGIAAPQIGESVQVAIVHVPQDSERYPGVEESERIVMINPELNVIGKEAAGYWEGCLSIPGLRGFVERPQDIEVRFLDEHAQEQCVRATGFLATVFQHEFDHLHGVLYVDKLKSPELLSYEEEFQQFIQEEKGED